ncbi:MAG: crotonase/enoyl-CoA hydratase family protein [Panacagrimonas sp.]
MNTNFETIKTEVSGNIAWLKLNRPDRANALDLRMWEELPRALESLDRMTSVRAIVLCGEGKHFTAGIDISAIDWLSGVKAGEPCATRASEKVLTFIEHAQAAFNAVEKVRVPVIAAIHGACIGGGVDLISACDVRLCTADARFCIKEVDLAVVPDVGTLQRLRHVIGFSATAELSFTAETFDGRRAQSLGLVSRVCESKEALFEAALEMARLIASKPPTTVRGIKRNLLWARDHSVQDGLAYTAAWNAGMLVGEDLREAVAAHVEKRPAKFRD